MLLGSINKNPCHIFEGSLLFGMEYVVRVTQFRRAVTFTGLSHQKNVAHVPHAEGKHYSSLFSSLCLRTVFFCPFNYAYPSLFHSLVVHVSLHPLSFQKMISVLVDPFLSLSILPPVCIFSTWIDSFSSHWFRINRDVHSADNMLHSVLIIIYLSSPYLFLSPSLSD